MQKINLKQLADSINEQNITEVQAEKIHDIAIIGISGRLPMAENINEFWDNLKNGKDCITDLPPARKIETEIFLKYTGKMNQGVKYKKGSYLERVDEFDYQFFNISPREASLMDPNQRIFLETAWLAVEDAGYDGEKLKGSRTGVYCGFVSDMAYQRFIGEIEPSSLGVSIPGNMAAIIPGRVSYVLDLKGPSLMIDTACSSSLVAVHTACCAIRNGDCEMAIVGSIKMNLLPLEDDNMLGIESKNYVCRAFDNDADGTCMGEGAIAVVLKPLSQAIKDRDHIYAVIKGTAVNQDGASMGITAPNAIAQADVIEKAWENAGIDPETITYIEAHGTGTKLGDPIEIDGINRAFAKYTAKKKFCAIGSVKTNLGHLDSAAGMVGLVKAVLALQNKQIPPSLHFNKPNQNIDFENSAVFVNNKLIDWESKGSPRRCGVSAFGLSGTNSHIVLEEAPLIAEKTDQIDSINVLTISAKTSEALQVLISNYLEYLKEEQQVNLSDLCYTANTGRGHYDCRLAIITSSLSDLREKLQLLVKEGLTSFDDQQIFYQKSNRGLNGQSELNSTDTTEIDLRQLTALIKEKLTRFQDSRDEGLLREICSLYVKGAGVNWNDLYSCANYNKISLPGYAFEKRRCWLDIPIDNNNMVREAIQEYSVKREPKRIEVRLRGNSDGKYTELEQCLGAIWGQILGFKELNIDDDFYELGGDSIIALQIVNSINNSLDRNLQVSELLRFSTIRKLADFIGEKDKPDPVAEPKMNLIVPLEKQSAYPLSSAQQRIYLIEQFGNTGTSYNLPAVLIIEGSLDHGKLRNCFEALIQRHEPLRTSFEMRETQPVQVIHSKVDFQIELHEAREAELNGIIQQFIRKFDLSKAPLFRVGLVKLATEKHALLFDPHHIITDGTSTNVIVQELIDLYEGKDLPDLRVQYKDFAHWQNNSTSLEQEEEYWINQFKGEIPVLNLPLDYPRPAIQEFTGSRFTFRLNADLTQSLQKTASEHGATLYMVLLAAYNILLARYTGQEDVVVGTVVSGRNHLDLERMVGIFINTLPIRNYPQKEMTFKEFLGKVKENTLQAFENQKYPYERLIDKLNVKRDLSRNPLFDVLFVMQNMAIPAMKAGGLNFTKYDFEIGTTIYDIFLQAVEDNGCINLVYDFSTKLFKRETMARMNSHLINILEQITAKTEIKLSEIDITPSDEKQLLMNFNETALEYPQAKTIQQLFEEQADRTPEAIAIIFKEESLTYRQVNERSNQLAGVLRRKGVKPNSLVGIILPRSSEMLTGILGILKAGGAYLPIDPEYPEERIRYMLEDSKAVAILTESRMANRVEFNGELIRVDAVPTDDNERTNLDNVNTSRDLAYVIYTSGSTGKPKGVMIEHRGVHNFIRGMTQRIDFNPEKTILALTTISFDIFGLETLLPLSLGLKVVIATEEEQRDAGLLCKTIIENQIDMLQITPSRMQLLLMDEQNRACLGRLTEIMIGGEALPMNILAEIRKYTSAKIYNMYGPTETTIWSTIKDVTDEDQISIGTPIANTQIYIVDSSQNLQPIGVAGELCIAGDGLARGYWERPELTEEKFIPNPFKPGTLMYRTDDLARWLPDGNIEFLGRIDHQVKIRGFRIELGEIETELLKLEAVREAVVVAKEDTNGGQYLCAYLSGERELTVQEIRSNLAKTLPDYMIPSTFVQLDRLPLTPNGKIDRKSLPEPDRVMSTGAEYAAPQDETEAKLVEIWREVLGVDKVGVNDNFFDLGGNSLSMFKLNMVLNQKLNQSIAIVTLFQYPTIRSLTQYLTQKDSVDYEKEVLSKIDDSVELMEENLQIFWEE